MKFSPSLLLFLSALSVPLCASDSAAPLLEEPPQRLDDYIVETNRATFHRKAPAVTHQILAADLDALNLPETGDALQYLPNLFIRKRFIGDKNSLTSIRGTSNRQPGRTLVLADGILLSNFLGTGFGNSPRWFLIAPEEIEKIAISYGPYSSLYAGNSIGGTVLFTTRLPDRFTASVKGQYLVEDFHEYGTDRSFTGHTGYVSIGDRRGKLSYFAFYNRLRNVSQPMTFNTINVSATAPASGSATLADGAFTDRDFAGAPRIIYGSQGPTAAGHDLFKVKLAYELSPSDQLRYSLIHWSNREDNLAPETYLRDSAGAPLFNGAVTVGDRTFTIPTNVFIASERQQTDLVNAFTYAHEPESGPQLTVTASWYDVLMDKTLASTTNVPSAFAGGPGQATVIGRTGWQNYDALLGWHDSSGQFAGHAPVAGWHFDHFFTRQTQWSTTNWRDASSRTALVNGTGGDTRTHALFGQDAWTFAPEWTFTAGVRWESWRATHGFRARDFAGSRVTTAYPNRTANAWSPKLALTWRPQKAWSARLSLARATRFPTIGELFQGSISANGSIAQSDPNLKPERDFAKDFTVERTLAAGSSLRASMFEEDVRDSLTSQSTLLPDGTSFSGVQNVRRVRARGAEIAFDRKGLLRSVDFTLNASYTNAVILENAPVLVGGALVPTVGKQFPRIPHWQIKSITTWRIAKTLTLSAATRYSSYQFNTLENSDPYGGYGGTDEFFVVDLKAAYRLPHGVTASIGVDNLTSYRYHVFHSMPQRTWLAELNWQL